MPDFRTTALWKNAFEPQSGSPYEKERARLRVALENLRDRAKLISNLIATDLPNFTVHDITHLDALWEYAELLNGTEQHLTPCEAFVLGAAFLIHDLGMAAAAYPEGPTALESDSLWADTMVLALKRQGLVDPGPDDIKQADASVRNQVLSEVLRVRHAQHAEKLPLIEWKDSDGHPFHLIDDPELRASFGPLIGRISHSHWWSVDRVAKEFQTRTGAPGDFPEPWEVDPLRLACLLRVADICHLDDRRAAPFREVLQKPNKDSSPHWKFQKRLNRPLLINDRLVYSAKGSCPPDEALSWWLAFDTLTQVDIELRRVDALLAEKGRTRLTARGVANTESSAQFAEVIRPDRWMPIDTRIRVSSVARVVAQLGGAQLYGDTVSPPLRELLQNAADAVRARRMLQRRPSDWGSITVTVGSDETGPWLEVEDTGVGMTEEVLTDCLLDFGRSFWSSSLMHRLLPGLQATGFQSTGQYGIGFFSLFMWGKRIKVVTQPYSGASSDALVLEFSDGLAERPLLRIARKDEYLLDGGTRVRVYFDDPKTIELLLRTDFGESVTLARRCSLVAPCLDVNIIVSQEGQQPEYALLANDWLTAPAENFCSRLPSNRIYPSSSHSTLGDSPPPFVLIKDDKRVYGRACVWPGSGTNRSMYSCAVVVGGFYASQLHGIQGVILGNSLRAARDGAIPTMPTSVLRLWATEEAQRRLGEEHDPPALFAVARVFRQLGVDVSKFPIALTVNGLSTGDSLSQEAKQRDIFYLVEEFTFHREDEDPITFDEGVIIVDGGRMALLSYTDRSIEWPEPETSNWGPNDWHRRTMLGAVVEALADGWSSSVETVLRSSNIDQTGIERRFPIGKRQSGIVAHGLGYVFNRPKP